MDADALLTEDTEASGEQLPEEDATELRVPLAEGDAAAETDAEPASETLEHALCDSLEEKDALGDGDELTVTDGLGLTGADRENDDIGADVLDGREECETLSVAFALLLREGLPDALVESLGDALAL